MVPMPDQTPLPFPDKPDADAPGSAKPGAAAADPARMTLGDAMTPPAADAPDGPDPVANAGPGGAMTSAPVAVGPVPTSGGS